MNRPYAVGIAGGTCSGKTTLSERLLAELQERGKKVAAFHMDAYYLNPTPKTIAPITGREYAEHNHPDALDLNRLVDDFEQALGGDYDYVIVEGLFALAHEPIRRQCDFKVFVDLRSDARLARRIPKFMTMRNASYEDVVDRYLDTVRFRHDELIEPSRWHADLVVNGTLEANKGVAAVMACLEAGV